MTKVLLIGGPGHGKVRVKTGHMLQLAEHKPLNLFDFTEPEVIQPPHTNIHTYSLVEYCIGGQVRIFYKYSGLTLSGAEKLFLDHIVQVYDLYVDIIG